MGMLFYERGMMAQEPGLHRLLREKTRIPVPRIVAYDASRTALPFDFLVMERLPGQPLTEARGLAAPAMDAVFRRVGGFLAEAHALRRPAYGYLGEQGCMPPQAAWWPAFRIMWNKLIDDTVACGGYADAEAERLRVLLDRHRSVFDRDVPSCLLHMDVWHQNILVGDDGRVTGLIDWDRALWGDPEIEFAVLDYCGVSVPAFWEGYGRPRPQGIEAAIRNRFYLLYELQKYILISIARRNSRAQAEDYRRNVFALAAELFSG